MKTLLSAFKQFVKVALVEEEPEQIYQPITHVYAFPKGSFDGPMYCNTPKGQAMIQRNIDERNERERIQRKHWFERLCGTSDEEIFSRYGKDQFGDKINN